MPLIFKSTVVAAVMLIFSPVFSQQGNLAGLVVSALGDVVAADENGNIRNVIRRSEIFTGDTITTSEIARIQLRMIDSAIFSLGCDSSLKIEDYRFEDIANDRVALRLLTGRIRTITGAIGQQNMAGYRFLVGESRVEIRGTDFEVVLDENGNAYFGNYDGGITIVNSHGSVRLGIGGDVDFAIVEPGLAPQGLHVQPQQLTINCF